jgi:citrate lyase subunit beta/citryl-CoA lyase
MATGVPSRSFLFVPGDSAHKMDKALTAGSDALILDLEDAVAPSAKAEARGMVAAFLAAHAAGAGPRIWVRINPLTQSESLYDLAAIMRPALSGVVVPKIDGPEDIARLSWQLDALEVQAGLPQGGVKILAVATETASSLFRLGEYRAVAKRLHGLTWGAEDLAASLSASTNRGPDGALALTYQMARSLCLAGARAAGVVPVETAPMEFRDADAVFRMATAARRDGFFGMMAIHPAQVPVINRAFSPTVQECEAARRVVDAFASAGNPGVVALDGRMLDLPHLRQAQRLLSLADAYPSEP